MAALSFPNIGSASLLWGLMPGDTEAMCGSHSTSNDLGKKPALKDILENEGVSRYTLSDKLWEYLQNYAKKHRAKGNGFGFGMPDLDGQTRTLSARYYKDGSEILIGQKGKNPRKLTPRECARLQGYPDEYRIVVSDTQAYKQFGNSVVVPLVAQVANLIKKKLAEREKEQPSDKTGGTA